MSSLLGASDLRAYLVALRAKAITAATTVAIECGAIVETQMKLAASGRPGPMVRSGNLRRSIHVEGPEIAETSATVQIGPSMVQGSIYPKYVEEGTKGPYPIAPRSAKALFWPEAKNPVALVGKHPGNKSYSYVRAGVTKSIPLVIAKSRAIFAEALEGGGK